MSFGRGSIVNTAAGKMEVALHIPFSLVGHEMSPLSGNHEWLFSGTVATRDASMVALSH